MRKTVVLGARPLSQIAHSRKFDDITTWFDRVVEAGYRVVIPEVVDYEVRRGLLRIPARRQIQRLDDLVEDAHFDPITRPIMQDAAHVWADARNRGTPFTADDRLDGDAILIAQVRALGDPAALTVITENVAHLRPFVPAMRWQEFDVRHDG
jgi:predicted nucleic acid-binding protein